MSRIQTTFEQLKKQGKKALIPYVTAGDPKPELMVQLLHELAKAGADMIELGIPFSDPVAEGTVIQAAHERALAQGVTLQKVLAMVAEFRREDKPTHIILMGYLNPLEFMGYAKFAEAAKQAGVDGVLIVDLPPEEAKELLQELRARAIDLIFLIAPTTTPDRMELICQQSGGYHYCVSLKGVTGSSALDVQTVAKQLTEIRKHARLPIGVGFGIRDAQSAAAVVQVADAVIIGAALVSRLAKADSAATVKQQITGFLPEIRKAMDGISV